MTQQEFDEKWGPEFKVALNKDDEGNLISIKAIKTETEKATIWITGKNHNVGVASLPNIEMVQDFLNVSKEFIVW